MGDSLAYDKVLHAWYLHRYITIRLLSGRVFVNAGGQSYNIT